MSQETTKKLTFKCFDKILSCICVRDLKPIMPKYKDRHLMSGPCIELSMSQLQYTLFLAMQKSWQLKTVHPFDYMLRRKNPAGHLVK